MISMDDIKEDGDAKGQWTRFNCSISGMVGLGGTCPGMVGVHIPDDFAREATAAMLGMGIDEVDFDCDVYDAVGEIANMLAGEIKLILSRGGVDISLSTPTIISGKEYVIEVLSGQGSIAVPFNRGDQQFIATVQLEM